MTEEQATVAGAVAYGVMTSLIMLGTGALLIGLGRRAADGRLGVNAWAGMRTRATRSSPEAWLAGHRAALRPTVIGGWITIATGLASLAMSVAAGAEVFTPNTSMVVLTGVLLGGTAIMLGFVIWAAVLANRAAAAVRDGGEATTPR